MTDSQNDIAWKKIFQELNILEKLNRHKFFIIKSSVINQYRQSRLMTKFDYASQLPKIFIENDLSLLPISRGSYIISKIKTFKTFENKNIEIIRIDFPGYIESIDINNITSESMALNCAYFSNIISDFTGELDLIPTVNGRMGSSFFKFNIDTINDTLEVKVENAQLEIDGGYEGNKSLCLVEAKNSISNDFIVRQLYYPFRLWHKKIQKNVRNLFLTYTNGIFHFREYEFEDPLHYNSIKLIKEKKYTLVQERINNELIQKILYSVNYSSEPEIAFPQANSFARIINLCEILNEKTKLSHNDITIEYDFDKRQTNYYTDACRYLGLVSKLGKGSETTFFLTDIGEKLFHCSIYDRQLEFIKLILIHAPFNKVLKLYYTKYDVPTKVEIVRIMKDCDLYKIKSEKTYFRRSSTILSWINWILEQIEE